MGGGIDRTSRRQLLQVAGASVAFAGARQGAAATPEAVSGQQPIEPPAWLFATHAVEDPYTGEMQAPQEPPPGTRYVGAEVEVINDSDQPLNFTPVEVRLRDVAGFEYRGGSAIGSEPMINPRNLNPGERSRGWVWFIVPSDAQLAEIVYVAPGPQYRVPLPQ